MLSIFWIYFELLFVLVTVQTYNNWNLKKNISLHWKSKLSLKNSTVPPKIRINYFGRVKGLFLDFDPCQEGRSQCPENSSCVVENDSFRCTCNPGFQEYYDGTQITCNDINECQSGQHECDYNAQCLNNIGSYLCQCNPGFEGNGFVCENARSCENITCLENAECVESNGIAECKCLKGFSGNSCYCFFERNKIIVVLMKYTHQISIGIIQKVIILLKNFRYDFCFVWIMLGIYL